MTDVLDQQWDEMSTLDACILIEETCASIYYKYAGIFADSPKFLTLWTEMAIEEEKHADVFRAIRAIHCSNYNCSDNENDLIKMIFEKLKSLNESINSKKQTLRDAILTGLILEKSVEKYHLEASKVTLDPKLAKLLDVMMEYSHGHVEMLQLETDSIDTELGSEKWAP